MSRREKSRRSRLAFGLVAAGFLVLLAPIEASAPCEFAPAPHVVHPAVHPALDRSCAAGLQPQGQVADPKGAPTGGLDCQGDGKCPYFSS